MTLRQKANCATQPLSAYMKHALFWPAICLLAACSTLQIEVDVYKGMLVNTKEIQLRQYVSLASSAKPLLTHTAEAANGEYKTCTESPVLKQMKLEEKRLNEKENLNPVEVVILQKVNKSSNWCAFAKFQSEFLCETRNLYEDNAQPYTGCRFKDASSSAAAWPDKQRPPLGLDALTKKVLDAMPDADKSADNKMALEKATDELNRTMIFFAQRILFYANNQVLFSALDGSSNDILRAATPVLQTLGNTILVHANDLQRQDDRDTGFKRRTAFEHNALQGAFQVPPSLVFDRMLVTLGDTSTVASAASQTTLDREQKEKISQELKKIQEADQTYRSNVHNLLAAYLTLSGDRGIFLDKAEGAAADTARARFDSRAIAALAPAPSATANTNASTIPVNAAVATPPTPALPLLLAWLKTQAGPDSQAEPQRTPRLVATQRYLESEQPNFANNAIDKETDYQKMLAALKQYTGEAALVVSMQLAENDKKIRSLKTTLDDLNDKIAQSSAVGKARDEEEKIDTQLRQASKKTIAVIASLRKDIIAEAEAAGISDAAGVQNLLKIKLSRIASTGKDNQRNDAGIALKAVQRLPVQSMLCASMPTSSRLATEGKANACGGDNPIEAIDNLIASLRAQRIQALSVGAGTHAVQLLDAINAAQEQRTSLIYLRPASDYLRSVYTANAFQENGQHEGRNMLFKWKNYLPVFNQENTSMREQVDKLYWQNVNKVSVSGGGNTNYVLAKDDVGNWYVKAYSADPEAIIKSATSLALFNSGKKINGKLLRRNELQRQLDDPKTSTSQADRLQKQLAAADSEDGATLLKMKERHAARYRDDTVQQAGNVLITLTTLSEKLKDEIAAAYKAEPACKTDEAMQAIVALDKMYLATARAKLQALGAQPASTIAIPVEPHETAIQAGLKAMYSFTGRMNLAMASMKECEQIRDNTAKKIHALLQATLVDSINERKRGIDRYEDGLSDIAAVASLK